METENNGKCSDPPPPVWRWVWLSDSLTKNSIGKRKKCTDTVEKPSKYNRNQVIRLSSPGMSCGYQVTPDKMGQEGNFTSAVYLAGTLSSSLIKSKTTEKARLGDILQDTWPVSLKTIKVMRKKKIKKEKLSKCPRPENARRHASPMQCDVLDWILEYNVQSLVNCNKATSLSLAKVPS